MYKLLLLLVLASPVVVHAQSRKEKKAIEARLKADQEVLSRIKTHVQALSAIDGKGTHAETNPEGLIKDYIINEFKSIGLTSGTHNGFTQEFIVEDGRKIDGATRFVLNEKKLEVTKDYFPLPYSANKTVKGSPAIDLRERGEPWFADVKDWIDSSRPSHLHDAIKQEAVRVAGKGGTALILFNSGAHEDLLVFNKKDTTPEFSIPIIYLTKKGFDTNVTDRSASQDIELNVAIKLKNTKGANVLGYIDNGMPSMVVISSRYNQIAQGENTTKAVDHNANTVIDNATGTAALIELARLLKHGSATSNNYLFVAFPGGEEGYYGSKYWLEHVTPLLPVNYTINMDKVGRYDAQEKLTISGVNTSAFWRKAFVNISDNTIAVKLDSTVAATGDHVAFIKKNIPTLFVYAGNNINSIKPANEAGNVNYEDEVKIIRYVNRLVEQANAAGVLAFTKPVEPPATTTPAGRFTVSLGVIPDNGYQGKGFKIGGVSPKRLADKIGLKAGDILLQLGDYEINEMTSYMKALSMFKQGDTTTLKVLRGNDEKRIDVSF